ncbi:MarR family winged helix-turn-helix transcriptional regulator [Thalassovita mangrovi]|uniref:MarR family transcriptional regulator n=1 Tax=Thalassovita mangrovi TaxID=2692236 RepID=A0A6L8LUX5_9RHOB|nr:MarR family transcriptional regulator [Thalassovita mangrovi]MYM56929.1 MarR family transcriptional regulator [Thalassovita mangrovi]
MRNIAAMLHEATLLMRRRFESAARPQKLTLMQWRFLGTLARKGAMRQVALGEAIKASPMTVSDVAERLVAAGLIRRDTDPDDSRAKIVALTESGERKTEIMRDISAAVFADAFDGVSEADLEALQRALPRIIENLGGTLPDKVE